MPNRKARSLSPSALKSYDWCPAQYLGTSILKSPGTEFKATAETAVGNGTHRTMKRLGERRKAGDTTTPSVLEQWARDYWDEEKDRIVDWQGLTDEDGAGWTILHSRRLATLTRGLVPELLESYGSMPLIVAADGSVLWYYGGILDFLLPDPFVGDFKTSCTKQFTERDIESYRAQAASYAAIIRHERGVLPKVSLFTSDTEGAKEWPIRITNTSADDALDHSRRVATEIDMLLETGRPFPRGRSCNYCPLNKECPQTIAPVAA